MANTYLKTPNSKYILTHLTIKEKIKLTIKGAFKKRYDAICEWLGIDNCIASQIWFFGTLGLSTFMIVATYLIAGFLYEF
ncbi:hypothetical protein BW425_24080 [Bacillus pseudomycoides]|uniref:DUF3961 domain-containing protein n=1 Tax=Bacillus pseudomycoides TaxID=64104 RepID=A0A1Y3MD36_9BACI|nr:hypothetical protein [Bacillus pseudomycoides]OUM46360.1 hypothetical protein BW425_24080 [Bacillus pseudomycoides]